MCVLEKTVERVCDFALLLYAGRGRCALNVECLPRFNVDDRYVYMSRIHHVYRHAPPCMYISVFITQVTVAQRVVGVK